MGLRTEYAFTLPKGYVDRSGTLHRQGTMRLATARDEIEPLRDARVTSADDPYLTIVVLARVITELGGLAEITTSVVEDLFAADLAFLQDVYGIINFGDPAELAELQEEVLAGEHAVDDELDVIDDRDVDRHPATDTVLDIAEPAVHAGSVGNVFQAAGAAAGGPAEIEPPSPALRRRAIEEVRSSMR